MLSNRVSAPVVGALLAALVAAGPEPAFAQAQGPSPRENRPYRGLFASGLDQTEQSLIAQGSVGGGYDSNVLADLAGGVGAQGVGDPRIARRGAVGTLSGSLSYSLAKEKVGFGASFGEATRYYPKNSDTLIHSYSENVGVSYRPTRRTTLAANQFVAYQPFMLSSLFPTLFDVQPGALYLPPVDLATGLASYLTYGANGGIEQQLSRRVTFMAGYNAQRSDTPYAQASLSQQGGNAGFRFGLTRGLGLRVGYARQEGRYAGLPDTVTTETYDVGLDYQKALSISRRTTVSFSSGTSALENTQSQSNTRTYFVTGAARLNHEIGRSWMASAAYTRGVQFLDTLLLPLLSDSFNGNVGGLITRRLEFSSGVQGSWGRIGFANTSRQSFDTYQAYTSLAYAMARWANVSVSYSYYQYKFDGDTLLPTGIARDFDRQSVRANLNLWAPLMQRSRRK